MSCTGSGKTKMACFGACVPTRHQNSPDGKAWLETLSQRWHSVQARDPHATWLCSHLASLWERLGGLRDVKHMLRVNSRWKATDGSKSSQFLGRMH